jgi:hypothetical protein
MRRSSLKTLLNIACLCGERKTNNVGRSDRHVEDMSPACAAYQARRESERKKCEAQLSHRRPGSIAGDECIRNRLLADDDVGCAPAAKVIRLCL